MRVPFMVLVGLLVVPVSYGQWAIQDSGSTADLRGIDSVGGGVAWASGSGGTVLRTVDLGKTWTRCATPPGAEALDFRGVQAFDDKTAMVMSSGKGDLSRLYKTTDGCATWKLVFTNPDKDGFWDALVVRHGSGLLIGDPVEKRFQIYGTTDSQLEAWERIGESSSRLKFRFDLDAYPGEALFAASNSVLQGSPSTGFIFASGGSLGAKFSISTWKQLAGGETSYMSFKSGIPLAKGATSGAFSLAAANQTMTNLGQLVAVGGNYATPDDGHGTSAWSKDGGQHWNTSTTQPHGYRSAVAFETSAKTWITVGPNGTDVSTDDGRNWRALKPGTGDAMDADQKWNALSLPFVVGPKGRIGLLEAGVLGGK